MSFKSPRTLFLSTETNVLPCCTSHTLWIISHVEHMFPTISYSHAFATILIRTLRLCLINRTKLAGERPSRCHWVGLTKIQTFFRSLTCAQNHNHALICLFLKLSFRHSIYTVLNRSAQQEIRMNNDHKRNLLECYFTAEGHKETRSFCTENPAPSVAATHFRYMMLPKTTIAWMCNSESAHCDNQRSLATK